MSQENGLVNPLSRLIPNKPIKIELRDMETDDPTGVVVELKPFDAETRLEYDLKSNSSIGLRGKALILEIQRTNIWLISKQWIGVEGITAEDCTAMNEGIVIEPRDFFLNSEGGHFLMRVLANTYINRQTPNGSVTKN